ncbi:MAG: dipeptidase [Rikenellaceae bacterium]
MKKNLLKGCLAASTLLLSVSCGSEAAPERDYLAEALELQSRILTLDTHADTPMLLWREGYDPAKDNVGACIDFPKMRKGKLDMATFAIFTGQGPLDKESTDNVYKKAKDTFVKIQEAIAQNRDSVMLIQTPDDIIRGNKEGKIMIFPSIENSYPIGEDLSRIDTFYNMGIRMFGIVHSKLNALSDSSTDEPKYNGLSETGKALIKKLNDLNALIDVSHASDAATLQMLQLSKDPIVATHSSAQSVASSPRNLNDEILDAFKANGGVIQLCFLDAYTKDIPENEAYNKEKHAIRSQMREKGANIDSLRAVSAKLIEKYPDQKVYVKDFVDHMDYIKNRIGVDYMGMGSDFDGGGGVYDCADASQFPNITAEMLRRGYTEEEIAKIWGLNFLRVYQQVAAE